MQYRNDESNTATARIKGLSGLSFKNGINQENWDLLISSYFINTKLIL